MYEGSARTGSQRPGDNIVGMPRLFLVGFMGAGKSSVGADLADRLGYDFVDLDEEISKRFGAPIREVFSDRGEPAFRAAESEELQRLAGLDGVVVATGGGAFCSQGNREIIHGESGVSVFLDVPWHELRKRLAGDHAGRPMYDDAQQAKSLFGERLPHYRRAMIRVALEGTETPTEVSELVLDALQEAACGI